MKALLLVLTFLTSAKASDSQIIECKFGPSCNQRISSSLKDSESKWRKLKLKNYKYRLSVWYPDEPPAGCTNETDVFVENAKVQKVETKSCLDGKITVKTNNISQYLTMDQMYDACKNKILKSANASSSLFFSYDKQGILNHCHYFVPYTGEYYGGQLIDQNEEDEIKILEKNPAYLERAKAETARVVNFGQKLKSNDWQTLCPKSKSKVACFNTVVPTLHEQERFSYNGITLLLSIGGGIYYKEKKDTKELKTILNKLLINRATPKDWKINDSQIIKIDKKYSDQLIETLRR